MILQDKVALVTGGTSVALVTGGTSGIGRATALAKLNEVIA
jgi:NAD(P)-dependent dehydrogenase (short-subunit alcohol dehydrogenase family)